MYSYVQDVGGTWWKTVDTEVVEVPEETVLTDPTGVHLGAGPYLLFYSRHLSDEQLCEPLVWPTIFSVTEDFASVDLVAELGVYQEAVAENNKKFIAAMHQERSLSDEVPPPSTSGEPSHRQAQGSAAAAADREASSWSMSVD